jgi:hypothetical protein
MIGCDESGVVEVTLDDALRVSVGAGVALAW